MSIGAAIFLIVLGAIFTFAVEWDLGWIDLAAVGVILMLAGVLWLALFFRIWNKRKSARAQTTVVEEHHVPRTIIEERRVPRTVVEEPTAADETRRDVRRG